MVLRRTAFLGVLVLTMCLRGAPAPEPVQKEAPGLTLVAGKTTVAVTSGARVLVRYRYAGTKYKPYVDQLFSPKGVNILRDSPHDHVHHHALMYAINVNDVNFWEEYNAPGAERHRGLAAPAIGMRDDTAFVRFTDMLDWVKPPARELLLEEERILEAAEVPGLGATLLTWQSKLTAPPGKDSVVLTGGHYHGLGLRFVTSMDKGGTFFNAAGDLGSVFRGQERLGKATWCAYTAEAEGKPVTVAMLGHPKNPRGPTLWFTMTGHFAYLSATLNLHKEPLTLEAGSPITLRYAVLLWDGTVKAATVEAAYRRWSAWPVAK